MKKFFQTICSVLLLLATTSTPFAAPPEVSGRYPHLALFNKQGECGIGAVVPWAGKLWTITYAPHMPGGSDDKLYAIDNDLMLTPFADSVGGTPANRLIHKESQQLIIGPYFIDKEGKTRVITPKQMPGRLTATARHLTQPEKLVYVYDMEGMLYEVDVNTLAVNKLFVKPVPGWHGKGAYTSQGRLVVANNGEHAAMRFEKSPYLAGADAKSTDEAGVLAEWDGKDWNIVERHQFTDVTGPGGIHGAPSDASPLWSIGWDKRSLLLKVLDGGKWHTFRLPKSDFSYDARHGWYTEWPRIREVVPAKDGQAAKFLMNLHGGWFDFPSHLTAAKTTGLAPIGSYLKITGDFCDWNGRIVFACDDASKFHNPLVNQSHSNLWFSSWEDLKTKGKPVGWGGPWVNDDVAAGEKSDPYLIAGYDQRVLHLMHASDREVKFALEVDEQGNGSWTALKTITVPAKGYAFEVLDPQLQATWVRLTPESAAQQVTASFHYGPSGGQVEDKTLTQSLADIADDAPHFVGIARPRGGDLGTLQFLAQRVNADGATPPAYYEMNEKLIAQALPENKEQANYLETNAKVKSADFTVDAASVIMKDGKGNRFRLPKNDAFETATTDGIYRGIRELVTERTMLNCHGTFYMLPREDSHGVRHIKPVCTHNKRISDFASWRGLLVLMGTKANAEPDGHFFTAGENQAGVWLGDIDDLWKFGKPRGIGGPWLKTAVKEGAASDPYLMTGYDRKSLELSHAAKEPVTFRVEIDVLGNGTWQKYETFTVKPDETFSHEFPQGFSAHWVRFVPSADCEASATLKYE